jgi:hypothetical protein
MKAMLLKHWLRGIGRPRPDAIAEQRAQLEQDRVNATIAEIYNPSVGLYVSKVDSDELFGLMEGKYSYADINNAFLRGIISEVVDNSPPLPTEPFERVNVHMIRHFIQTEGATLNEAREKLQRAVAVHNEANPTFDWITYRGRQAHRTSDVRLLAECHRAARQAAREQDGLSPDEREVAFEAARIAGIMMREQLRVATLIGGSAKAEEHTWAIQAFAFGALVAALQGQGVPWEKSPYVSTHFAQAYMPDYDDHIELANIILHFGVEMEYQKYRVAGELAFTRYIDGSPRDTAPFPDDLARALGYS